VIVTLTSVFFLRLLFWKPFKETNESKEDYSKPSSQNNLENGNSYYATRVLVTVTAVALMINYVETMVVPGIPTIQSDFNTTRTIASWITSALLIVGSITAPLFGRLGDNYGKKRMFLIALGFYTVGVVVAGFAPSIYILLIARAIQGVGFSIIPLALAIITDTFPKEMIAPAQGILSATFAIGASIGLIGGSYIVQDLGWPYSFHSAAILSVILIVVTAKVLKKDVSRSQKRVDYTGAAMLMVGIALTLVYVTEGPDLGWFSTSSSAFLIPGLALIILFFLYERGRTNPLIHLGLLGIRNVMVANLVGIISGITMFILFFAVVYYAQQPPPFGLGLSIITTGLTLGPATLVMLVLGPLMGRAVSRIGPKPVLPIASVILIVGLIMFIIDRSNTFILALDVTVALAGAISLIIPIVNMVSVSVPQDSVAVGLGINTMLRNVGGAIGPILATTIMTTYITTVVIPINGLPVPTSFANSTAFNFIFALGIGLTLAVMAISLTTKNYTFKK
jgi:MFS family permease